ncbi:Hypothetical predicted protein [Mytilus galloprovincialis]|uniref:Uncharacterized protein n=1 Tax=Mytilus galloprovincialis TaxID=29158 RepID=A0A8B6EXE8_MYTGA|nr:Hypothetical predicted protein [Mytilus galloprovincialis]VDI40297.1 Hypothetical predicted protein [Mytilus galloprovincialis]
METRYDHHEREIVEERVIGRFASFTPKLARNALEERMYDLNIRLLYVLLTKAMKEKTEILNKIQEERTTYVKPAEQLEFEYKETTCTVEELRERVDILETENTILTESNTELKLKYEKHVEKSRVQKEMINKLEQDLENYGEIMEKHQELKIASSKIRL